VKVDMKRRGLIREDALIPDGWRSLTTGERQTFFQSGTKDVVLCTVLCSERYKGCGSLYGPLFRAVQRMWLLVVLCTVLCSERYKGCGPLYRLKAMQIAL